MQQSELKREDLKSEVDHLIALVNRHKDLFEVYLKLVQEDHDLESSENTPKDQAGLTN